MDVPEPRAAHHRGRLHTAFGREYLRQGPRHRAGLGEENDLSPAAHRCRAPDVPRCGRRRARPRGRLRGGEGLPGAVRDQAAGKEKGKKNVTIVTTVTDEHVTIARTEDLRQ